MLQLLTDSALAELTVTQVCHRARVHRTTFYQHYTSLHDAAMHAVAHATQQLLPDPRRETAVAAFTLLADDPDRFRPLSAPELAGAVQRVCVRVFAAEADQVTAALLAGGFLGLLEYVISHPGVDPTSVADSWRLLYDAVHTA